MGWTQSARFAMDISHAEKRPELDIPVINGEKNMVVNGVTLW